MIRATPAARTVKAVSDSHFQNLYNLSNLFLTTDNCFVTHRTAIRGRLGGA